VLVVDDLNWNAEDEGFLGVLSALKLADGTTCGGAQPGQKPDARLPQCAECPLDHGR